MNTELDTNVISEPDWSQIVTEQGWEMFGESSRTVLETFFNKLNGEKKVHINHCVSDDGGRYMELWLGGTWLITRDCEYFFKQTTSRQARIKMIKSGYKHFLRILKQDVKDGSALLHHLAFNR